MLPLCHYFFECGVPVPPIGAIVDCVSNADTFIVGLLFLSRCHPLLPLTRPVFHWNAVTVSILSTVCFVSLSMWASASFVFRRVRDLAAYAVHRSNAYFFTVCSTFDGLVDVVHGSQCFLEQRNPATASGNCSTSDLCRFRGNRPTTNCSTHMTSRWK